MRGAITCHSLFWDTYEEATMPIDITKLRLITGAAVVAVAGGSGFYMQMNKSDAPTAPGALAQVSVAGSLTVADQGPLAPVLPPESETPHVTRAAAQPVFLLSGATPILPVPGKPETGSLTPVSAELSDAVPETQATPDTAQATAACEVGFTANAAPGAMVDLTLEAPCYADQVVDIFHAGTRFTTHLDDRGLVQISVPALEEDAFFNALFTDGRTEATDILMLTAQDYQRFALFWKGETGFALYALENGAEYGEPGMVSAEQPYDAQRAIAGEGGFFSSLGEETGAYHTVVYSWPVRLGDSGPAPELNIEAEVLQTTCATEITATLLATGATQAPKTSPLFMDVPDCAAVGQYLVLSNPALPVRIAAN